MMPAEYASLPDLVIAAFRSGESIDLSSCTFRPARSDAQQRPKTPGYYRFLAGLCKMDNLTTALEIGTHHGGSTLAIHHGVNAGISNGHSKGIGRILTVDVKDCGAEPLNSIQSITRLLGDPIKHKTLDKILKFFSKESIDLLFLDSVKMGSIVLAHVAIFSLFLKPKYIIMDDITLNDSMERMWKKLEDKFGEYACNAPLVLPEVRVRGEINPHCSREPGLGVIAYQRYLHGAPDQRNL